MHGKCVVAETVAPMSPPVREPCAGKASSRPKHVLSNAFLGGATMNFFSFSHSLMPRISTAIMEIDRGDGSDGDARPGQSPRDREIPSLASIPPLSPSMDELDDRLDDSRSTQRGCAKCNADGLEVYHR